MGQSPEKARCKFTRKVTQDTLKSSAYVLAFVKCYLPGMLIRDPVLAVFNSNHVITLCLACTEMTDSQEENVLSINHVVFTNSVGTVTHFYQVGWWEPSILVRTTFHSLPEANYLGAIIASSPLTYMYRQAVNSTISTGLAHFSVSTLIL